MAGCSALPSTRMNSHPRASKRTMTPFSTATMALAVGKRAVKGVRESGNSSAGGCLLGLVVLK
jgi:hypothetical protein